MRQLFDAISETVFPFTCVKCGKSGAPICESCLMTVPVAPRLPTPDAVDALYAAFAYTGAIRRVITQAKYQRMHAALNWLAAVSCASIPSGFTDAQVLSWIPTSATRWRERGFDQAELLAKRLGVLFDLPVRKLLRHGPGGPQTGRSATERRANAQFAVPQAVPSTVLLIDDVCTTGATLSAAARALKQAGARHVNVFVVARTP